MACYKLLLSDCTCIPRSVLALTAQRRNLSELGTTATASLLSPMLFFIYMDRIVKKSESCGGVKISDRTAQRLLFTDNLVLLEAFSDLKL